MGKSDQFAYEKYNNLSRWNKVINQVNWRLKLKECSEVTSDIKKSEGKPNQISWHVLYQEYVTKCNEITKSKGLPLEEWRSF
ncbi:hypothetical protein AOC33_03535 [Polynucleobacter cosmopolitanus]|uniref:Uncharacterized protein n=1 Tax=Polynucleobacter cosmopolitanus TaxID=351345 RepID=A0A229FW71_9BURK|nr:hypothetical protein AOC33_03535 [Polynucleobacter cosmopolitanus]